MTVGKFYHIFKVECVCMLYVRVYRPENHLRCWSSGNFYLGFCNRLSHWPRLEKQARLARPVSSTALPVSASPALLLQSASSGLLCFVLNLRSQTQVLLLSKQTEPRFVASPLTPCTFSKSKFSSTLQRARQTWP